MPDVTVDITVNGVPHRVDVPARTLLVHLLRDNLRLTGTHVGCDTTQCGACTVHLDGEAVKSCTILAAQAHGREITTIEGIADSDAITATGAPRSGAPRSGTPDTGGLDPLQQALWRRHGLQCGYCTPGMVMAIRQFLAAHPNAGEEEIRRGLSGNLCRCTGYQGIIDAALDAAGARATGQETRDEEPTGRSANWMGRAVVRREDPALLTGRGQYVDDVPVPAGLPAALHAHVVRSPVAHARIAGLDVSAAQAAEGVVAVFTAADLAAAGVGPLPPAEGLPPGSASPPFPALAAAKVLWAGQPVALVVATTPAFAADAAELVDVSYEELPAVTTPMDAAAPGAPVLHEGLDDNVAIRKRLVAGDAERAFAAAAYRVGQRMASQRIAPVALEPRGVLAWVAVDGRLEVRLPTQRPHGSRKSLCDVLGLAPERVRVSAGDVGGAFGAKGPLYPDQVAVCFAALALGRPVKWIEERSESFLATTHGRDQVADLEMAVDAQGRITALRGTVHASFGAYFTPNAPASLLSRLGPMLPQGYRIPAIDVQLVGVLANTTPIGPYRGAGRPEAAYFCERLIDLVASETGLDPAEVRRRNLVPPAEFPYRTCTGLTYDSGDYRAGLDLMLSRLGYSSIPSERAVHLSSTSRLLGVGLACFVEPGGITPGGGGSPDSGDRATVTVAPSGQVTVAVGTSGHGQGHETAFAQLAADLLGVPYADVTVVFGDTDTAPFGFGTFGSRSAVAGGTAIYHACQAVLAAATRVDAPLPVQEAAARMGGLSATAASGAPPETYASGAYGCVVSVDPDTGQVDVLRVIAVDDCGVVINPLIVEGQVLGAIAQGLGQALSEEVLYDPSGQPLTGSLMDYAVPSAESMPPVESYLLCTPSPANPLGVKGMGESGTIGITPAVVNAVMDALRPYGVRHLDMPLTAEKIWTAIHSA